MTMTPSFISFNDGFAKDCFAKMCEPHQPPHQFLWTGRKPKVGQRVEVQVNFEDWCRVSGVVTHLDDQPTIGEWKRTTKMYNGAGVTRDFMNVDPADGIVDRTDGIGAYYANSKEHYGSVHGHEITVYGYLNFDMHYKQSNLPLKDSKVYKLKMKFNDGMNSMWILESIEDVTSISNPKEVLKNDEYPEVFRNWKEGYRAAFQIWHHGNIESTS